MCHIIRTYNRMIHPARRNKCELFFKLAIKSWLFFFFIRQSERASILINSMPKDNNNKKLLIWWKKFVFSKDRLWPNVLTLYANWIWKCWHVFFIYMRNGWKLMWKDTINTVWAPFFCSLEKITTVHDQAKEENNISEIKFAYMV